MKKLILILIILLVISTSYAHPGGTNKQGCHTCKTNCEKYGIETGFYHKHNPTEVCEETTTTQSTTTTEEFEAQEETTTTIEPEQETTTISSTTTTIKKPKKTKESTTTSVEEITTTSSSTTTTINLELTTGQIVKEIETDKASDFNINLVFLALAILFIGSYTIIKILKIRK